MWSRCEMKIHPIFQIHVIEFIVNDSYCFILKIIFELNVHSKFHKLSLVIRLNL